MNVQNIVAILGLAFTIVGCGGSAEGTQSAQVQPVTQPVTTTMTFNHCATNANNPGNINDAYGNFILSSDIWNASAATAFSQCIKTTINSKLGVINAEFDWNFVSSNSQVKIFPNVQHGQQTGFPNSMDTTTVLPAQVSSMPDLNVTGSITTTCNAGATCYFDSGFDIFFSKTLTPTTWPPKSEMMILTSFNFPYTIDSMINLTGAKISTVTIDGVAFEVVSYIVTPPLQMALHQHLGQLFSISQKHQLPI